MATTSEVTKPTFAKALLRRGVVAVALIGLMLIPAIILMAITRQPSATYAAMGGLIGAIAVVAGGRRIGVVTSFVLGLLAPIAIITGLSPITGAAVMAIMTLAVGRMSRYGLHRAVFLVPAMLAWPILSPIPWIPKGDLAKLDALLAKPGASLSGIVGHLHASATSGHTGHSLQEILIQQRMDTTYLTWVALFFFIGAIIPTLLLPLVLHRAHAPTLTPHSRREAMPYTITITVLTAVATYYFLDHPKQAAGAFMIATILVLTQVGMDIEWSVTIQRVLGTLGGLFLTFGVMALIGANSFTQVFGMPFPLKLYIVGIVFGMAAIMLKFNSKQWPYYLLMTPTTALLNAYTTSQVISLGRQRVTDNLVGALLVIAAGLITVGTNRFLKQPADEHAVVAPPATPA